MIIPTDQMVITQDTTLLPGVYFLPSGIQIKGRDITLDGNGAVLVGEDYQGSGILSFNTENIIIKNLSIHRYYWGIHLRDCKRVTISNCLINGTHELPANTIFLNIWIPVEKTYGGAILLDNVQESRILDNNLSHQMNGLLTYQCHQLAVKNTRSNYCSGWGFHLNNTCDSLFEDNSADYCCRYEPRGTRIGHMGADSSGFLIVNWSSNNRFLRNNARLGGDGFFLAGMNPDYEPVGCDNNLFEENDASYSPNNAFEATFSRGNIFRSNFANHSNYGFWLGFSKDGILEGNQMTGNRQAGIAAENGINFSVSGNHFLHNRHGILLWSKRIPKIEASLPDNATSLDWQIEGNTFIGNHKAIRIVADQDHGVRALPKSNELGFPAPKPMHHMIHNNKFEDNVYVFEQLETLDTTFERNELSNNLHDQ